MRHIAGNEPAERRPIVLQATADFYTDPGVFASLHPDMPDLQLPAWASGASDFIRRHRCLPCAARSENVVPLTHVKQLNQHTGIPL